MLLSYKPHGIVRMEPTERSGCVQQQHLLGGRLFVFLESEIPMYLWLQRRMSFKPTPVKTKIPSFELKDGKKILNLMFRK